VFIGDGEIPRTRKKFQKEAIFRKGTKTWLEKEGIRLIQWNIKVSKMQKAITKRGFW
jgi:hypothetical protein